ncbi:PEP/pyruvate-binding domain-containing protein [Kitasatospora mediocidica]|uniref:PEP/pyruvate-binding domain-containing protein n=1 Tax=Kitasatospora mediocidica TaxID=58352 RepID=UPI00068C2AB1|nr:PEP/pyruvate-binding domain-containing protein [Kitasatospora mediocidica]
MGEVLTLPGFSRLAGTVSGYRYVKVVLDRGDGAVHFIDSGGGILHVQYVACDVLGMSMDELARGLDAFNDAVYRDPGRRFCLGTLALHGRRAGGGEGFLSLETVDVDTMSRELLRDFYRAVRGWVDPAVRLVLKPANHLQEGYLVDVPAQEIPRVLAHELYSCATFVPLNPGSVRGRVRVFRSAEEYRAAAEPPQWHDILVMPRIPEDIPRVAGIIHAEHTTPLSHVNVMAAGWRIPNAVRLDVFELIERAGLDGQWAQYRVDADAADLVLTAARPPGADASAPWAAAPWAAAGRVALERPELAATPISALSELRTADRVRFGTKAAHLGEICHLVQHGSPRWLGFYQVPRPPRADLLRHLARQLDVLEPETEKAATATTELAAAAQRLVKEHVRVPRGIALPFSLHQRFLDSSATVRDAHARLAQSREQGAALAARCLDLQQLVRATPLPADLRDEIERAVVRHLTGVPRFVVRSSSNAEDLAGFSAAGLYTSLPGVGAAEQGHVLDAVREVWASLVSPRAVLLRRQAGIPLDHCAMGVIVQEQVEATTGGVLVTCNPLDRRDFRTVCLNVSRRSVAEVVSGSGSPLQYLCNTVEGTSRTVSLGSDGTDLDAATKAVLRKLALIGRLLQSHFSPDDSFARPVDVEWLVEGELIHLLQLRPFHSGGIDDSEENAG